MTMDLWYDLAIRERPHRDAKVIEPSAPVEPEAPEPDAKPDEPVAVDLF